MSGQDPQNPDAGADDAREAAINALLDGELSVSGAADLKAAAAEDSALAQSIVAAWQLQVSMDQLQIERAPGSLGRKLKRIPRDYRVKTGPGSLSLPRWVLAGGMLSLVMIAFAMMMAEPAGDASISPQQVSVPGPEDTKNRAQTERDLAIAFHYLDKVGLRVGRQIQEVLNDEIAVPVKENISKHMPYTGRPQKEKHA